MSSLALDQLQPPLIHSAWDMNQRMRRAMGPGIVTRSIEVKWGEDTWLHHRYGLFEVTRFAVRDERQAEPF